MRLGDKMNNIVDSMKKELMITVEKHKYLKDYDFWNEHIKYVVENAIMLAKKYSADVEIVELSALLHDIALSSNFGPRDEHHIHGAKLAEKLLNKYGYDREKIEKVKRCILNHRDNTSAKTTKEEICVADADIMSHFDNIPMLFSKAYLIKGLSHSQGVNYVKNTLMKDYEELSADTKILYKDRYEDIMKVVFGNNS